MRDETFGQ